ncbi:MAG: 2'-deoxycytidine 5'-triphosphate deaminase [Candidatus Acidiferrales bacterium]
MRTTGVFPSQTLRQMARDKEIVACREIEPDQFQPASIDLRLGSRAHRVRGSFLPGIGTTVEEKIRQLDAYPIDLTEGAVLERGCVYVIQLMESVALRNGTVGITNPKSSTGRLDVLTRMITDEGTEFDRVGKYSGPLYVEVTPRTFSVVVHTGTRLNQIRFRRGTPQIAVSELERLLGTGQLLDAGANPALHLHQGGRIRVTVDLHGTGKRSLIGWRARKNTDRIDLDRINFYDPLDYWEPLHYLRDPPLILDPNEFYILATVEPVSVPPHLAAEMVAYETSVGEFRVHYAGFFDPGFGYSSPPSKAVLEVRSHEVPFMLDHGQTVGLLQYEPLLAEPSQLYGTTLKSSYQGQGLALAKQFRAPT